MKSTNLRPYSILALFAGALSFACGTSSGGTGGSGGSSGSTAETGGSNQGGSTGSGGSAGTSTKFDAGTDPNRNMVMAGGLCQRFAEIQCAGQAACCSKPAQDVAACTTTQQTACSTTLLLDSVAMDAITAFDATKAAAAFQKFEDLASKCDPSISLFAVSTDGFRGILGGTVAVAGACDPSPTAKVRTEATTAALASCSDPATNACLPAMTGGWKCAPRAAADGHCFTDANCQEGLYCDNPTLALAGGKCGPRKATGADCTNGNECTSYACQGMKCVAATADTAYCLASM